MANSFKDTIKTAKNDAASATEQALDTAKDAMASAKEVTGHTYASTVSTLLKGATAISGIFTIMRKFDRDDGLAWFGLTRRRPLRTVGLVGAGLAFGVGAGMLLAPKSGAELRRLIASGFAKVNPTATPETPTSVAEASPAKKSSSEPISRSKNGIDTGSQQQQS